MQDYLSVFQSWHSPDVRRERWNAICLLGTRQTWLEMTNLVVGHWHNNLQNRREHACIFLSENEIQSWFVRLDRELPGTDIHTALECWTDDLRYTTGHDWTTLPKQIFCRMGHPNMHEWIYQSMPSWISDCSDLQTQFDLVFNFLKYNPIAMDSNEVVLQCCIQTLGDIFRRPSTVGTPEEWMFLLAKSYVPYDFRDIRQVNKVTGWFERHIDSISEKEISDWLCVLRSLPDDEQSSIALHWCLGVPKVTPYLQPWFDLSDERWLCLAVEHYATFHDHPNTRQWDAVRHAYALKDVWLNVSEAQMRTVILALIHGFFEGSTKEEDTSWL